MSLLGTRHQQLRSAGHMSALDGATGWLNSKPLDPAELRGHVALVNFWTLTCIKLVAPRALRPRLVAGLPDEG